MRDEVTIKDNGKFRIRRAAWDSGRRRWVKRSLRGRVVGDGRFEFGFIPHGWNTNHLLAANPSYDAIMVGGSGPDELWILSRTKDISPATLSEFRSKAKLFGYDTSGLRDITHFDLAQGAPFGENPRI